jgi:branched-chain amino acid transport system ATP-binding protein
MLEVTRLVVRYGKMVAVSDVSLVVERGKLVGLVGANGAGKSTTLRAICGLIKPASGSIRFDGQFIENLPVHRIARMGISCVPEGRGVLATLTVAENLRLGIMNRPSTDGLNRDLNLVYSYFPRLKERNHQMAGLLSGGEQQMLSIARAMLASPKLLIVDEMSLGLAPKVAQQLMEVLVQMSKSGMAVLCVEQNTHLILKFADYAYALENGRSVLEGTGAELRANDTVVDSYLGRSELSS